MKITNLNKEPQKVYFHTVLPGETFEWQGGAFLCVADPTGTAKRNAVNLQNGTLTNFSPHAFIYVLDAELTVRYENT